MKDMNIRFGIALREVIERNKLGDNPRGFWFGFTVGMVYAMNLPELNTQSKCFDLVYREVMRA